MVAIKNTRLLLLVALLLSQLYCNSIASELKPLLMYPTYGRAEFERPHPGEESDFTIITTTGSGYFKAIDSYSKLLEKTETSDAYRRSLVQAAMEVQRTLDVAAYSPEELNKIASTASISVDLEETDKSQRLMHEYLLLQQLHIAQNKLIIRLLKKCTQNTNTTSGN